MTWALPINLRNSHMSMSNSLRTQSMTRERAFACFLDSRVLCWHWLKGSSRMIYMFIDPYKTTSTCWGRTQDDYHGTLKALKSGDRTSRKSRRQPLPDPSLGHHQTSSLLYFNIYLGPSSAAAFNGESFHQWATCNRCLREWDYILKLALERVSPTSLACNFTVMFHSWMSPYKLGGANIFAELVSYEWLSWGTKIFNRQDRLRPVNGHQARPSPKKHGFKKKHLSPAGWAWTMILKHGQNRTGNWQI